MTYPSEILRRIDMILLGLIEAHDGHAQKDDVVERRLNIAREALFGIPAPVGNRFIDDQDALLQIAATYIAERGEPKLTSEYALYWETEPKGVSSFRELVRVRASELLPNVEKISEDEINALTKRLKRKFNKHKVDLLREAYFSPSAFSEHDVAVAESLSHWLDDYGIRMGRGRQLKLGHKIPTSKSKTQPNSR